MLFNSFEFIFALLPISILVSLFLIRRSRELTVLWLIACSLFFYGWWNISYLTLIIFSLAINFGFASAILNTQDKVTKKILLIVGISINLSVLCYFKYYNFAVDIISYAGFNNFNNRDIILPLAISFITFQQIAFLCDCYSEKIKQFGMMDYFLFITFFPQLIAGPIVYGPSTLPQYKAKEAFKVNQASLMIGMSIFILGLFKKIVIADSFKPFADLVFNAPANTPISFIEAWSGTFCYGFQLYFDFSAYSDMAIGLARIFNIHLPINFNSPYTAKSIIEFWHRWHITLSTFLKEYLYVPLGGNKKGAFRKHINLLLTMLIGGLWHGAGINFIIWGGMHGMYLIINHTWKESLAKKHLISILPHKLYQSICLILTISAVMMAWVFFRATSLECAMNIIHGMIGLQGFIIPEHYLNAIPFPSLQNLFMQLPVQFGHIPLFQGTHELLALSLGAIILWALPNTNQFFNQVLPAYSDYSQTYKGPLIWALSKKWAFLWALLSIVVLLKMHTVTEFLYYQF